MEEKQEEKILILGENLMVQKHYIMKSSWLCLEIRKNSPDAINPRTLSTIDP